MLRILPILLSLTLTHVVAEELYVGRGVTPRELFRSVLIVSRAVDAGIDLSNPATLDVLGEDKAITIYKADRLLKSVELVNVDAIAHDFSNHEGIKRMHTGVTCAGVLDLADSVCAGRRNVRSVGWLKGRAVFRCKKVNDTPILWGVLLCET